MILLKKIFYLLLSTSLSKRETSQYNFRCYFGSNRLHFCESLFENQKSSAMLQVDETKIDSTFETFNEMPSIMNGNKSSLVSFKIFLNFASSIISKVFDFAVYAFDTRCR